MSQLNVFEQVIKYIPEKEISRLVSKHHGDKGTSKLSYRNWFMALLYGQLSGHDSLRALEKAFSFSTRRMRRLNLKEVHRSTLSDANHRRSLKILEGILEHVLKRAKLYCLEKHQLEFDGNVLALDSSIIELCLSLSPWANFRRQKAAVKLHVGIDIANQLPLIVTISPAKEADITVGRRFEFEKGTTVVFDRAYWDSSWLKNLTDKGVFWVTRQRKNNKFKVHKSFKTDRTQGYICDQTVYQKSISHSYSPRYRKKLRRIVFKDPDTSKRLVFITNRFDLPVETICKLYKARWKVELFFKALKQNLRVKKFLGNSANAVKAQIYIALIAYVLVQIVRAAAESHISIPDAMAVVGTLLLLREPLARLLRQHPKVTRHPPNLQQCLPF